MKAHSVLLAALRRAVVISALSCVVPLDANSTPTAARVQPPPDPAALRELLATRRYAEAEAGAAARLASIDPSGDGVSLAIAETLDLLVEARAKSPTAADAATREAAERAVRMRETLEEPVTADGAWVAREREAALAASLNRLCVLRLQVSEFIAARPVCERSLALRRGLDPPDPAAVAESANTSGVLLTKLGDYDAALPLMEEAVAARRQAFGEASLETAQSLNSLGNLHSVAGRYAEARVTFERCLSIREALLGPDDRAVGTTLNNLGTIIWMSGDLMAARPFLERGLEVRLRSLGPDHPDVAITQGNLASLLGELGDFGESRRLYETALATQEKTLGPEDTEVAATLLNLAITLNEAGDHAGSRRLLERALAIREKVLPPDHPDLARARLQLGNRLRDAGDLTGAKALYDQALSVLDSGRTSDARDLAFLLSGYGVLLSRMGDQDGARRALARSVTLGEALGEPYDLVLVEFLLKLARLERAAGHTEVALDAALDAAARMRRNLLATVRFLPERQALRYEQERGRAVDLALAADAGIEDTTRLWDVVVRSRALVLDEMARRHAAALRSDDAQVATLVRDLERARGDLASLVLRGSHGRAGTRGAEELRALSANKERLEQSLGLKSAEFRNELADQEVGLARATAELQAGDALVAYVVYRDPGPPGAEAAPPAYGVFVQAGPGGRPVLLRLGTASAIDDAVAGWRERVTKRPEDDAAQAAYRRAATSLRRLVWDPVAARLGPGIKRVFIVPDGVIQSLQFATLPAARSGYLLEHGPLFHYLSAERDLARHVAGRGGAGLLALGGPDFDAGAGASIDSGGPADRGQTPPGPPERPHRSAGSPGGDGGRPACPDLPATFAPLPNAAKEVDEVVSLWERAATVGPERARVATLSGTAAGEAALRDAVRGRRVVHLATHAFVADERCGAQPTSGVSPLLFSGLALAGANRRAKAEPVAVLDDGLLTAEEIASLDLRGVEWVVLSACETGIGPIQSGEGVLGLRRAFQVAGAASLILTLWKVDDVTARQWVADLYEERLKGKETASAVQAASLRRLTALRAAGIYDHPFGWGAFVATGNWR